MPPAAPGRDIQETHNSKRRFRFPAQAKFTIVLVLAVTTLLFGSLYVHSRAALHQARQTSPVTAAEEAKTLTKKIGIHMVLPSETPTIATVENTEKLAGQVFFKNARDGDKVLMYTQHKKAILYRPTEDKIIEVAYLNIKE